MIAKVISAQEQDIPKTLTFKPNTLIPIDITEHQNTTRRRGTLRNKWTETGLQTMWNKAHADTPYDEENMDRIRMLKTIAHT